MKLEDITLQVKSTNKKIKAKMYTSETINHQIIFRIIRLKDRVYCFSMQVVMNKYLENNKTELRQIFF